MPLFVAAILGGLLNITASLVGRVLVSLGIGVVTYTGFSSSIDWLKSNAVSNLQGLGSDVVGMLSVLQVGTSISIIFSAMMARLLLQGLQGDTVKKWVTK